VLARPRRVDVDPRLRARLQGHEGGFGWYERTKNPRGALLPQQITEFTNSGLMAGVATVMNMSSDPEQNASSATGARTRRTARSRTSSTA
jgi:hypothetical protein